MLTRATDTERRSAAARTWIDFKNFFLGRMKFVIISDFAWAAQAKVTLDTDNVLPT